MIRRSFIRRLSGGALALPFLARKLSLTARAADRNPATPDLRMAGVAELRAGMDSGRFTAVELVRNYRERIGDLDRSGPALNSVIALNPDAETIAEGLDRERTEGRIRGPLHGIPVLIKDNIDTADRMMTTAGSLALEGHFAGRDASVVERLRAAGAVLLGKTNLSEWANFRGRRSTSGWSARGGQTRNPHVLDRNPSGSSSGSGVAVSAGLCAVAVGTETDGSIMSPSSLCGVVGIKPTVGLVSRTGIIPISSTQDTAGPMARTVADAAVLLSAMSGEDDRDAATARAAGHRHSDFTQFLDEDGLRSARIGVCRQFFGSHPAVDELMERAMAVLKSQGASLVELDKVPTFGQFGRDEYEIMLYEFKDGLDRYLAAVAPEMPVHSLEELIRFNERHAGRELAHFGQEHLQLAARKGPLTDTTYLEARARAAKLAGELGIDAVIGEHRLDALMAPTSGPAHVTDYVHGDRGLGGSSSPAAVAGYPSITIPAGDVRGLPVGLSLFGRAWSEPTLIRLAYSFEQATEHRRAPGFHPSIGA